MTTLKINQYVALDSDKVEASLRQEDNEQGHRRPSLFRNIAIKKRFITVDYSNYTHKLQRNKKTRQAKEQKIQEKEQPKRNELLKLLNTVSSHIRDPFSESIESKPVFPMSIIKATIQGKYIGLSSYRHRQSIREQQQSKLIRKKIQICNKQSRRSSVQVNLNYIGGISCKSVTHVSQRDRYYLKTQRTREPCCKKSQSEYIEPIAITSRMERGKQQIKKQGKRVRCRTTNSIRHEIGQEAINIKKN